MTAPQLAILADDLTGAADTAGCFASGGLVTVVPLCEAAPPPSDVVSVSSECRDAQACDVPGLAERAIRNAQALGNPGRWYRKIDSALRGHPGYEINLTMQLLGFRSALIAPALPAEERATIHGRIHVHGLPLHTTPLGLGLESSSIADRIHHVIDSPFWTIGLDIVRQSPARIATEFERHGHGLCIADAETDADLEALAAAVVDRPDILLVGSAGFATALHHVLPLQRRVPPTPDPLATGHPVLIVAGTRHEATVRQIEHCERSGMTVIRPARVETSWTAREIRTFSDQVCRSLQAGHDTVFTITGSPHSPVPGHVLAQQMASVTEGACRQQLTGGLVLTGGDVAAAVCALLGVDFLWVQGEIQPAIPWATMGTGPLANLPLVTKAGSFGGSDALTRAAERLKFVTSQSA